MCGETHAAKSHRSCVVHLGGGERVYNNLIFSFGHRHRTWNCYYILRPKEREGRWCALNVSEWVLTHHVSLAAGGWRNERKTDRPNAEIEISAREVGLKCWNVGAETRAGTVTVAASDQTHIWSININHSQRSNHKRKHTDRTETITLNFFLLVSKFGTRTNLWFPAAATRCPLYHKSFISLALVSQPPCIPLLPINKES